MSSSTISVQEAIKHGLRNIASPSSYFMIASVVVPILLMIVAFSFFWLLLIPTGILSSILYGQWTSARWQLWAYEHVNDIHQLQRSGELVGLLSKGSHERVSGMLSGTQKEALRTLQERFNEEAVFVDDPTIPGRTPIYATGSGPDQEPVLALNSAGIWTEHEGFFEWDIISNERIPQVTYSRSFRGISSGGGSVYLFRFDHPNGCFELPMAALSIAVWELDLLLYIYRGRFAMGQIPASIGIGN